MTTTEAISPANDDVADYISRGLEHLWVHTQQQADLEKEDGLKVIVRGEGIHLWDIKGRKFIDAMSGLWVVNAGHGRAGTTQQRPHPGQQFLERERFGQVVVGAGIEPGHPLGNRITGGQHQDRQVVSGTAQLPAHLEPVKFGHHDVQHQSIGPIGRNRIQRLDAVLGQRHRVTVERERPAKL